MYDSTPLDEIVFFQQTEANIKYPSMTIHTYEKDYMLGGSDK